MNIRELAGLDIDEYKLVSLIGQGGMSAVYSAYQEELDRNVAIKILSDELAEDPNYIKRFQGEAKMAAALEHPHIVPVYDFGLQNDLSYVAMRLLSSTLTDKLYATKPMSISDVLMMLEQVAKALDYAHSKGIVHRDVKPSNIMFDDTGIAYLVDFGIAKAMQQADTDLTAEQMVLGTPSYMPPELWRGDAPIGASDQYALAIVVFQILTGQLPFIAETPSSLMYKHLNDAPPRANDYNPNLSQAAADVLRRAMSKHANQRYPLVSNFINALAQAMMSPPAKVNTPEAKPQSPNYPASLPTAINQPIVPTSTVPNQVAPRPPSPQAPSRPVSRAMPQQGRRRPQKRPNTVMMQVASGGIIGIGIILILIIVVLLALLYFFSPESSATSDNSNNQEIPVTEVVENTASDEPVLINRSEPTLDLGQNGPIIMPSVNFVGIDVDNLRTQQTLIAQNPIPVRDVVYSPNGQAIAAGLASSIVRLWYVSENRSVDLTGHVDVVSAIAFNPDGTILASAGRDAEILLWDVASGERLGTLSGHAGAIRDLAFSPDGTLLASGAEDGTLRLWEVSTGQVQRSINADPTRVLAVAFSPTNDIVASGGRNGRVRLWDTDNGTNIRDLASHSEEIRSLSFSTDGTLLASSSTDNRIVLWDVASGTIAQDMDSGRDVFAVNFNPDGTLLASGDRNNEIRLWDVASGTLENTLSGHIGWVFSVSFSPDGAALLSSSGDGSVRLWR